MIFNKKMKLTQKLYLNNCIEINVYDNVIEKLVFISLSNL